MLKRGPVSAQTLADILENTASIESDYELAELLRQIVAQQPLDEENRAAFFKRSVGTIGSDYEQRRVLSAVVSDTQRERQVVLEGALTAASAMGSDYEAAIVPARSAEAEQGRGGRARRVLQDGRRRRLRLRARPRAAGGRQEARHQQRDAARGVARLVWHERLRTVAVAADRCPHTRCHGDLRDAYLAAAERLSGYEQNQVFAALVKNERTRK